ncbi:hypothetical protein [Streptomyces murinus]|uniref:hypothetical protein n=1 Tax=Streptomyces murinus TaxID=33900 RepID=UPI0018F4CECC|nr:hypothetical protein [Streptomyces murinus]
MNQTPTPAAVWIDGDPLMEAIAAAVWEHCRTEGTSTVADDPRNIAAVVAAVVSPPPSRAAEEVAKHVTRSIFALKTPSPDGSAHYQSGWDDGLEAAMDAAQDAVLAVLPAQADRTVEDRDRYRMAWRSARERAQAFGEGILLHVAQRDFWQMAAKQNYKLYTAAESNEARADRAAVPSGQQAAIEAAAYKTAANYVRGHSADERYGRASISTALCMVADELYRWAAEAQQQSAEDFATAEHHAVDGTRYLCHTDDHYCPSEARPAGTQQQPTDEDILVAVEEALESVLLPNPGVGALEAARDAVLGALRPLVDQLRQTTAEAQQQPGTEGPTYPYADGDVTVLGPEVFTSKDGGVICWRGENYIRQEPAPVAQQPAVLPPVEGPEYTPCVCDHIEPEHTPDAGPCYSCDCEAYRPTPTAPLHRSKDNCPGFPEQCTNLRPVDPHPPAHGGGIRCGCGDEQQPAAADGEETPFGADGCTCKPWTTEDGKRRFLEQGETVDRISGWHILSTCPHHA